jgi:uncharacterized repeat protein (TIGR01451 family)
MNFLKMNILFLREEVNMKVKINKVLITVLFFGAFAAQAKNSIELKSEAFQEKEEAKADGSKEKKVVPVVKVVPGEEVLYVITYKNTGKEPATNVVVTNPIPKHMSYRNAEATAVEMPEVSVDGGKVFGELTKLKIKDKLRKMRPALPGDVTHVRWKVVGAVQPNSEGKVRLRAVLN